MTENSNGHAVIDCHIGHISDARRLGALDTFDRAALTLNLHQQGLQQSASSQYKQLCSAPLTGD
jgi:hypothetical protein